MSSRTPNHDSTPDMGSNYLMDGFDFDEDYNGGTLDGARLPEAHGLSALPDGVVTAANTHMSEDELRAVVGDGEADFRQLFAGDDEEWDEEVWLSGLPQPDGQEQEGRQEKATKVVDFSWLEDVDQDPDRLPEPYHNKTIEELEQAWGSRTDGVQRVDYVDRKVAQYQASLQQKEPVYKHSAEDLRFALARAMRKSSYGESLESIKQELVDSLGAEARRLRASVKALDNEHGLVGNVYIRASSFPGLDQGKWAKQIKRKCKTARYLIACGSCDACQGGQCGNCVCNKHLGLKAVASVPWNKAYAFYAPRLELTGRLDRTATVTNKREALRQAFLTPTRDMSAKTKTELPIVKAPSQRVSLAEARKAVAKAQPQEREVIRLADLEQKAALAKVRSKLGQLVKANFLSASQVREIQKSAKSDPRQMLKEARRIVKASQAPQTRAYEGEGLGKGAGASKVALEEAAATLRRQAAEAKPKPITKQAKAVNQALRYAQQAMSEGYLGDQLDALMEGRFSQPTLKAASGPLVQIRKKHEGLAGFVYVDASAYASGRGTEGCDKGAFTHRTNQLKTVLAMERCGSCVFRNANNNCQKYNKLLVDAPPVPDPQEYQAEQLRLASATDAEVTASLFTDPSSEFGLQNDAMDFDFEDTPTLDKLAEYSFGGFHIEEE